MHKTQLLVATSNPKLLSEWRTFLGYYGYESQAACSLSELRRVTRQAVFDVVVLDAQLFGDNPWSLIGALRQQYGLGFGLILVLSDADAEARIAARLAGADSCLQKPVNPRELRAVIDQLLARLALRATSTPTDGWRLTPAAKRLVCPDGNSISLTGSESMLLACLLLAKGNTVSRAEISAIFGKTPESSDGRWLDPLLSRLKKKVAEVSAHPLPISTFRNQGYAFAEPGVINPTG